MKDRYTNFDFFKDICFETDKNLKPKVKVEKPKPWKPPEWERDHTETEHILFDAKDFKEVKK